MRTGSDGIVTSCDAVDAGHLAALTAHIQKASVPHFVLREISQKTGHLYSNSEDGRRRSLKCYALDK